MTLEYLEIMEDVKSEELRVKSEECEATLRSLVEEFAPAQKEKASKTARRKLQRSFKSNTRIYDDGSIEVDP